MSLQTPTTKEISDNLVSLLQSALNQQIPLFPKSFLRILAKVLAAVFILLYKYAGFIFAQMFVQTASGEATDIQGRSVVPLNFWGQLAGVGNPTPATHAELSISITVESQGASLPAGTQLIGASNNVIYLTQSSVALDDEEVSATVRASSDPTGGSGAGTIGNLNTSDVMEFANPLADVARQATVVSQVKTASNAESVSAYRQRVRDRFQKRPQGGAYADYEQWGEEAAGIINCYPYTGEPGQVDVYSEATVESSGSSDGIPTEAQLKAVLDIINFDLNGRASRRSANAFVNSLPITRTKYDITVTGLQNVADLTVVKERITNTLKSYFLSLEPYIIGLSIPPRRNKIRKTRITALIDDIVAAAGGNFNNASFTLQNDSTALSSYELGEGEKAGINQIQFL